jgi:hypothetical protein
MRRSSNLFRPVFPQPRTLRELAEQRQRDLERFDRERQEERYDRERQEAEHQQRELDQRVRELQQQLHELSSPKRKRKSPPELSPLQLKIENAIKQHGDPQTSDYKKAGRHLGIKMSRTVWWRERKRLRLS